MDVHDPGDGGPQKPGVRHDLQLGQPVLDATHELQHGNGSFDEVWTYPQPGRAFTGIGSRYPDVPLPCDASGGRGTALGRGSGRSPGDTGRPMSEGAGWPRRPAVPGR
jgi:hypothetical protein